MLGVLGGAALGASAPAELPASRRHRAECPCGALASVPIVGYLLSPLRNAGQRDWVRVGALSEFPIGETRLTTFANPSHEAWDGPTSMVPCYVRRMADDHVQVFAVNCAHLGCPVRWFPESGLSMCPCHGGVYYDDGRRASGPPPRGLFEYSWQIRRDDSGSGAARYPRSPHRHEEDVMLRWLTKAGAWLDARLQVGGTIRDTMAHPCPGTRRAGGTCSGARRSS